MTLIPVTRDPHRKGRRQWRAPLLPKGHADGAAEHGFDGASFSGAVFNLSTTVVGAGIMALPAAVKLLGLLPGLAAIALAALLTRASVDMILRFGRPPSPSPKAGAEASYGAAVGEALGCTGRAVLQACVVVNNLGILVVYMIIIVHPIESELRERSQMRSVVEASMWLCAGVYVATSLFGYLLFGERTEEDVLANFDGDLGFGACGAALSGAVRLSYAAHLMLVFPVVFFSLRLNLDAILFPLAVPIASDRARFAAVTAGLMGAVFLGANFVPSIWDAFQFTGATAAVAIGFLFPAAMALRDVHGIATTKDKVLSWLMILLGVSSSVMAISSDIRDLFSQS